MSSLRERRRGTQDQFGVADGVGEFGRHQRELYVMATFRILDDDARSGVAMRGYRRRRRAATASRRGLATQNRPPPRTSRCRRRVPRSSRTFSCELFQPEMLHLAERGARQVVDKDECHVAP